MKIYQKLKLEIEEHILWLTLNDEATSNSLGSVLIHELVEALKEADKRSDIRVIVITGAGKNFSSGGNIKDMQNRTDIFTGEANELRENYTNGIQEIPRCLSQMKTPIIAMVNGAAIGAGLDITCMCDIRVASLNAKFGETFTGLGLVPGDGGTYFLQRIVGFAKAMEMTLTANIYSAVEAKEMGLVNFLVSEADLKEETRKIAKRISSLAPMAIQMAKKAIVHAYENDLNSQLDLLSAFQAITQTSSDHSEALQKFKTKETPTFKHR